MKIQPLAVVPVQAGIQQLELSRSSVRAGARMGPWRGGAWTRIASALAFAALAIPAHAAAGRRVAPPPERTELHVVVFGSDPCPKHAADEIVICARLPESERYRIPKPLRDQNKTARRDQSWVARVRDIEETGRDQRPNSCSAVGSGGQTGCFQKFMRDARAQKQADAEGVP